MLSALGLDDSLLSPSTDALSPRSTISTCSHQRNDTFVSSEKRHITESPGIILQGERDRGAAARVLHGLRGRPRSADGPEVSSCGCCRSRGWISSESPRSPGGSGRAPARCRCSPLERSHHG